MKDYKICTNCGQKFHFNHRQCPHCSSHNYTEINSGRTAFVSERKFFERLGGIKK